jgi:arylsulfatase A-like enzyme
MTADELSRRGFLKLLALTLLLNSGHRFGNLDSIRYERGTPATNLPNILILVFDAFSAKHLSFFDYHRYTTPNLSKFANRATVFHRHYAGGNFTLPGTASLLTGVYPWSHRGLHLYGTLRSEYIDRNIFAAFAEDYYITTYTHNALVMNLFNQFQRHLDQLIPLRNLAVRSEAVTDLLFPNDYATSFWAERVVRGTGLDMPSSLFLSLFKIAKNFSPDTPQDLVKIYNDLYPRGLPTHTIGFYFLLEDAIDWIKTQVTSMPQPFLGYYHLLPPHEPYRTRREFIGLFSDGWKPAKKPILRFSQGKLEGELNVRRRNYDEYIAYVDAEFGRLYDHLDRSGILENTYVIVTSDHGQLFERGIHGHLTSTLYDPVIHIPLLISRPGKKERQDVFEPTSCVDLLPTLLHLAGKTVPDWCEGDLLPTFGKMSSDPDRMIFAVEAKSNPKMGPLEKYTIAMIESRYKLISYFGYGSRREAYELYDLHNDPEERQDLFETKQRVAAELKEKLAVKLSENNH